MSHDSVTSSRGRGSAIVVGIVGVLGEQTAEDLLGVGFGAERLAHRIETGLERRARAVAADHDDLFSAVGGDDVNGAQAVVQGVGRPGEGEPPGEVGRREADFRIEVRERVVAPVGRPGPGQMAGDAVEPAVVGRFGVRGAVREDPESMVAELRSVGSVVGSQLRAHGVQVVGAESVQGAVGWPSPARTATRRGVPSARRRERRRRPAGRCGRPAPRRRRRGGRRRTAGRARRLGAVLHVPGRRRRTRRRS